MVAAARKRTGQSLDKSLANELLSAYQHKGSAIQKREEVHKTAVANQVSGGRPSSHGLASADSLAACVLARRRPRTFAGVHTTSITTDH